MWLTMFLTQKVTPYDRTNRNLLSEYGDVVLNGRFGHIKFEGSFYQYQI